MSLGVDVGERRQIHLPCGYEKKRASFSNLVQNRQRESEVTAPQILDPRLETNQNYAAESNPPRRRTSSDSTLRGKKKRNADAVLYFDCTCECFDSDPTTLHKEKRDPGKAPERDAVGTTCFVGFKVEGQNVIFR